MRVRNWTAGRAAAIVRRGDDRQRAAVLDGLRGNSFYTLLQTWWRGTLVGEDQFGNRYYRARRAHDWRREKRWVVFAREAEPTLVPPGWVGWLHKRIKDPPSDKPLPAPRWEKEPLPNLTGTPAASMPSGALQKGGRRPPATGDYEPWQPE